MDRPLASRRLWLGAGIALAWLVMTGWLIERELGGTRLDRDPEPAAADAPAGPTSARYALVTGGDDDGQRVGDVAVDTAPEARHGVAGVTTRIESRLALELMGRWTELELEGTIWRASAENTSGSSDTSTPRAEVEIAMVSNGTPLRLEGGVHGETFRGRVLSAADEELPLELPVPGDLLVAGAFGQSLRFPDLEPGDDLRIASLDPLTLQPGTARVRCLAVEPFTLGARTVEAKKLEVTTRGYTSTAWVDVDGEVLRASTPFGLEIVRLEGAATGGSPVDPILSPPAPQTVEAPTLEETP